jgi:uncharacterized protein (DUF2126 family)
MHLSQNVRLTSAGKKTYTLVTERTAHKCWKKDQHEHKKREKASCQTKYSIQYKQFLEIHAKLKQKETLLASHK